MSRKNERIARNLMHIAKQLVAYDDDGTIAKDLTKRVDKLSDMFDAALGERAKALREAYARVADLEKEFKDAFKDFDAATGYKGMVKAAEEDLLAFQKAGGDVGTIQAKLKVAAGKSKQPSYKEWLEIVASLLNEQTYNKFMESLEAFKKDTATIKTGFAFLDKGTKEWSDEAKKYYEERGLKMPKASVSRTAGFKDVVKEIGNAFKRMFANITSWCKDLVNSFKKNTSTIKSLDAKLQKAL